MQRGEPSLGVSSAWPPLRLREYSGWQMSHCWPSVSRSWPRMNAFLQVLPYWAVLAVSVVVELAVTGVLANRSNRAPKVGAIWAAY